MLPPFIVRLFWQQYFWGYAFHMCVLRCKICTARGKFLKFLAKTKCPLKSWKRWCDTTNSPSHTLRGMWLSSHCSNVCDNLWFSTLDRACNLDTRVSSFTKVWSCLSWKIRDHCGSRHASWIWLRFRRDSNSTTRRGRSHLEIFMNIATLPISPIFVNLKNRF